MANNILSVPYNLTENIFFYEIFIYCLPAVYYICCMGLFIVQLLQLFNITMLYLMLKKIKGNYWQLPQLLQ